MIIRAVTEGELCISQSTHSWISGQLARNWGNGPFFAPKPLEEVCLGAEQHDVGWLPWDMTPRLNPDTGLPYNFSEMPLLDHLEVWSRGAEWMSYVSRYAGLLVSMHNRALCEHFCHPKDGTEAEAVQSFLSRQTSLQERLLRSLQTDSQYADCSTEDHVHYNSILVWLWDAISLHLCMGISKEVRIESRAANDEKSCLFLAPIPGMADITVSPWPFKADSLTLPCEGRVLTDRFETEPDLHEALENARSVTLSFRLRPS